MSKKMIQMDDTKMNLEKNYHLTEEAFEAYLPPYLKNDIAAFLDGARNHSSVLDCLYCELQASINAAYYGQSITEQEADCLRRKYLGIEV